MGVQAALGYARGVGVTVRRAARNDGPKERQRERDGHD